MMLIVTFGSRCNPRGEQQLERTRNMKLSKAMSRIHIFLSTFGLLALVAHVYPAPYTIVTNVQTHFVLKNGNVNTYQPNISVKCPILLGLKCQQFVNGQQIIITIFHEQPKDKDISKSEEILGAGFTHAAFDTSANVEASQIWNMERQRLSAANSNKEENLSTENSNYDENRSTEISNNDENLSTENSNNDENLSMENTNNDENLSTEYSNNDENRSTENSNNYENLLTENIENHENLSTENSKNDEVKMPVKKEKYSLNLDSDEHNYIHSSKHLSNIEADGEIKSIRENFADEIMLKNISSQGQYLKDFASVYDEKVNQSREEKKDDNTSYFRKELRGNSDEEEENENKEDDSFNTLVDNVSEGSQEQRDADNGIGESKSESKFSHLNTGKSGLKKKKAYSSFFPENSMDNSRYMNDLREEEEITNGENDEVNKEDTYAVPILRGKWWPAF